MKSFGLKMAFAATTILGFATTAAQADDWGTVSGYVAVTNDYRFRGISQNDTNITPQASVNWSGPDGFYAGVWASKTNWSGFAFSPTDNATPTVEIDIYGGKHFDLGGWDLNVEAYYYAYPDADKNILGPSDASYFEGIFQLSHSFGDLSLTATGAVSPEFSLGGGTGGYIAGTFSYPLLDWLSVSGTVGHQWVDAAPTDYTHFDLGLSATYRHWVLDVRANGTDMGAAACSFYMPSSIANGQVCTTGVVATLTYNIPDLFNL
jgi:uncharacterized protein (TIGR02001 family)